MNDDNKTVFGNRCLFYFFAFERERSPDQPVTTFERGPYRILSKYEIDNINNFATILSIDNPGCHEDMTDFGRGVCNKGCYEQTIKGFSHPFLEMVPNKA